MLTPHAPDTRPPLGSGQCSSLRFIMQHIQVLRMNGRVNGLVQALVDRRALENDDLENQFSVLQRCVDTSMSWCLAAIRCGGLWYGVRRYAQRDAESMPFDSFFAQVFRVCESLSQLDFAWVFEYARSTATMVHMLNCKANLEKDGGLVPETFAGKIEFRDVHFAYPTRSDITILKGVSFTIHPGESVALVGHSGSGKSTCVALLQRLYAPDRGVVLLDDVPIERYDALWLRQRIGTVPQDTVLFNMSVEENIKLGRPEATTAEVAVPVAVQRVLRGAGLCRCLWPFPCQGGTL